MEKKTTAKTTTKCAAKCGDNCKNCPNAELKERLEKVEQMLAEVFSEMDKRKSKHPEYTFISNMIKK